MGILALSNNTTKLKNIPFFAIKLSFRKQCLKSPNNFFIVYIVYIGKRNMTTSLEMLRLKVGLYYTIHIDAISIHFTIMIDIIPYTLIRTF